ncbi:ankyrin repeat domain-containing protein [Ochrobactrum cytisi]|nr:ankyrin repeat domain-containing protein [Brucella cytisi]
MMDASGEWPCPRAVLPAASISPLFRPALIKGEEASVLLHLRRHAPVNGRDANGRTPLMIAATNGRSGICELLVLEGADVSLRDTEGCTAVDRHKIRSSCYRCQSRG